MVQINIPSESYMMTVQNRIKVIQDLCSQLGMLSDEIDMATGSGEFANVPENPAVGTPYFCTDKQTVEGEADGIVIYYNGTGWVDALGRAVE